MAEYIEKQALLKKMHSSHTTPLLMGHMTDEDVMFKTMVSMVEEQPTADVVEVVRCKDCKHFGKNKIYRANPKLPFSFCEKFHHNITTENDYCSYGERRCK